MAKFSSYAGFVAVMGYCPADPSVIDRGRNSIWHVSRKGNLYRGATDESTRATVCRSKRDDSIGYVWNVDGESGWVGPFSSFDDAMDHADEEIFHG